MAKRATSTGGRKTSAKAKRSATKSAKSVAKKASKASPSRAAAKAGAKVAKKTAKPKSTAKKTTAKAVKKTAAKRVGATKTEKAAMSSALRATPVKSRAVAVSKRNDNRVGHTTAQAVSAVAGTTKKTTKTVNSQWKPKANAAAKAKTSWKKDPLGKAYRIYEHKAMQAINNHDNKKMRAKKESEQIEKEFARDWAEYKKQKSK